MSAPVLLGRYEHDSPAWHEARRARLGGSEVAAVLGLSPWESRFSLWHRKLGYAGPQADNGLLVVGRYIEDAVATWWADQHPEFHVSTAGTYVHPNRPWQLANPDRLVYSADDWDAYLDLLDSWAADPRANVAAPELAPVAILECKFSPYADGWGDPDTDDIPVYYRCQTLWYSDVFGGLPVHVAGLVDNEFAEWRIEHDPDDAKILVDAGREFMDSIEQQIRPDIDAHAQTYQIIREQHPDIDPVSVEIDGALASWFLAATTAEKDAKALKQHAASKILDTLGRARNAVAPDGERIAYRKPNGDHPPYLCPDPKAVKARQGQTTIREAVA